MAALESAPLLGGAAPPRAIRKSDGRVVSLDQFRGATMLVMLIVNFSGNFAAFPRLMKHGYGSQATIAVPDLVMPCFLFCVGFAFRITSPRRVSARGSLLAATWGKWSASETLTRPLSGHRPLPQTSSRPVSSVSSSSKCLPTRSGTRAWI